LDFRIINVIFPAAFAITLIGILEVFSVSKSLAFETGKRVDYNQEILSIGLSNGFLSLLTNTMPASGSISRTLFNYKSRAKTRFSAVFCGLFVAFFIFLLWPFVRHIPAVALASILIMLVPTFLDYRQIKFCFTVTKGDSFVFLLTMGSCLLFSLDIAFFIGIVISIASYLKRAAVPHVVEYAFDPKGRLVVVSQKKKIRRRIRIIGIGGELFFGSVDVFQTTLQEVAKNTFVKSIVLRLNNVYYMDASMCFAILSLYEYLKSKKKHLVISGITKELWQVFLKAKLVETIGEDNLFISDEAKPQLSTWNACVRAQKLST
jgi:SulP family sulfate permease